MNPVFRGLKPTATSRCRDVAPARWSEGTEVDAHSPETLIPFIPFLWDCLRRT